MDQSIAERLSWQNVTKLEDENRLLRETVRELESKVYGETITSARLIEDCRTIFDPHHEGMVAEIHVVQQQQHVWLGSGDESHHGNNRLTIEGAHVRRALFGSTLENIHGQLHGRCLQDIDEWGNPQSV